MPKKLLLNIIKAVIIALVVAFIVSIVSTLAFQYYEGTQIEYLTSPTTTITISNETTFSPPFEGLVRKGSFDSIAKVYVCMSCPYANLWKTFNIWMSLDNSSWVIVPFLESTTNDPNQMAFLGLVNFDNPKLTIYQKSFVPPQTVLLPPNVTAQDVSSMKSNVLVKKVATPADTTQWILTFFAVFGFAFSIVAFVLSVYSSLKDSESNRQDSGQGRKKTVSVKRGKTPKKRA